MGRIMAPIEHVVLLMFENRSFDNVLGWLYDDQGNRPKHNIPAQDPPTYNGLDEQVSQDFANPLTYEETTDSYPIVKGTCGHGLAVPSLDPWEEYEHVNNQLFGDSVRRTKDPKPPPKGHPPEEPRMLGFLQDFQMSYLEYYAKRKLTLQTWEQTLQILMTFTADQLPVLNGLARAFAVSDRWFSSVPTQTNPNRAFAHCGTSLGRQKNKNLQADEQFFTDTIWNVLDHHGSTWAIYYHDDFPAHSGTCYTEHSFPHVAQIADARQRIRSIDSFFADAKNGNLPAFTFLEPKWGWGVNKDRQVLPYQQGNDYHPPSSTRPGEEFLKRVYDALVDGPSWDNTLLIVTFDEHGGTFDHEPPPWGAVPPDDFPGEDSGFKFDRFGVRVPTLLVSPYIREQTVFRSEAKNDAGDEIPYDHTSVIATVLKWQGIDPRAPKPGAPKEDDNQPWLGRRVAAAPTFENVLAAQRRSDLPKVRLPPPDAAGAPLRITNETPAEILVYVGWLPDVVSKDHKLPTTIWGASSPEGRVLSGKSVTYSTDQKRKFDYVDRRDFDYYVQASYWVGSPNHTPSDEVDSVTGLNKDWRLFWKGWKRVGHHQTLTIRAGRPTAHVVGSDKKGRIRIVNNSLSQIYWKVGWGDKVAVEAAHGRLGVGQSHEYDDHSDWGDHVYWLELQYWTSGLLGGWESVWASEAPWQRVGRNATVMITQDPPAISTSCP